MEHFIEGERVGGGVVGGVRSGLHIVAHGREQSGLEAHQARHLIDEGGGGGLAVGAGHTDQMQLARWVVPPLSGQIAECYGRGGHHYICDVGRHVFGQLLAHHGRGPFLHSHRYELMAVDTHPGHSHEESSFGHLAGVGGQGTDGLVGVPDDSVNLYRG